MASSQPERAAIGLGQRFPMISMIRKLEEKQQVTWEVSVPAAYLYKGPDRRGLL
jgi:hypothetical protein